MEMEILTQEHSRSTSHIIEVYKELGEYERHFNRIQSVYRAFVTTWFTGTFAGIAFLYSSDFGGDLPISRETTCALIALAGGTGITLLWLLDFFVYHRLLLAVIDVAQALEAGSRQYLPKLREGFAQRTRKLNVRTALSIFYAVPTVLLCVSALLFSLHPSAVPQRVVLWVWTGVLFALGCVKPLSTIRPRVCQVVLVCGLPGTGKTRAASILSEVKGLQHLSSDVIRKELGLSGRYCDTARESVYEEMLMRAAASIENKRSVVLDATFDRSDRREQVKMMANRHFVPLQVVEIICPNEDIVAQRLSERKGDDSEASYPTYQRMKVDFQRITEPHVIIDNSGTEENLREWLMKLV